MIQSEDLLIYWARNSLARGERNGKLKDKSRQTRRPNVWFFKNLVRRGFAEPQRIKISNRPSFSPCTSRKRPQGSGGGGRRGASGHERRPR